MARKKRKGGKTPDQHFKKADQLQQEAKGYFDKAKDNLKDAGKAFIHGSHQGVRSLYGAAKGAIKAAPLGDKTPMLKGAWNGFWDTEPFKEGTKSIGKFYGGLAKSMMNSAIGKQLNKKAKVQEFIGNLKNDLSWYNNYPESTQQMIGPNFNARMGVYEDLYDLNASANIKMGLPSAAMIQVILTRGDDTDLDVSAAINRLYTSIRQANSGSVNWKPYQLDAFIYNYRLIIALYSLLSRGLKYLNKYSVTDKGVPYGLFAAQGLDYDQLAENAANMRNFMANFRTRMASYAIPKLDVLKRTYWLFSHGFWDSDDFKHQTYFVSPKITNYYSMAQNKLVAFSYGRSFDPALSTAATGTTSAFVKDMLVELLKEFLDNDVYSIISGDIVKAFGVTSLFVLDEVPATDQMPIEGYEEEFLQQIQNAYLPRTVGGSGDISTTLVHVNTDDVGLTETCTYVDSTYQTNPTYVNEHTLVNMYKNDISNLDVLGATRLIALCEQDGANYTIVTYGTELFSKVRYIYYNYGSNTNLHKLASFDSGSIVVANYTTTGNIESAGLIESLWSAFDWSPRVITKVNFYTSGSSTTTAIISGTLFDINNYAKIDTISQLRRIHSTANQSLYYSPLISKVTNNVQEYGN